VATADCAIATAMLDRQQAAYRAALHEQRVDHMRVAAQLRHNTGM
jgi:hypothetical protein